MATDDQNPTNRTIFDQLPTRNQVAALVRRRTPAAPNPISERAAPTASKGSLQSILDTAVGNVLGRSLPPDDPQALNTSLEQAFTPTETNGRTLYAWTPNADVPQRGLAGTVTGAQASLYEQAQVYTREALKALDNLVPLDPAADPENISAIRAIIRSDLNELNQEMGLQGGPRLQRVNHLFRMLLGDDIDTDQLSQWTQNLTRDLTTQLAQSLSNLDDPIVSTYLEAALTTTDIDARAVALAVLPIWSQSSLQEQITTGIRGSISMERSAKQDFCQQTSSDETVDNQALRAAIQVDSSVLLTSLRAALSSDQLSDQSFQPILEILRQVTTVLNPNPLVELAAYVTGALSSQVETLLLSLRPKRRQVGGNLQAFAEILGLVRSRINTVKEEHIYSGYLTLRDYVITLELSWQTYIE